VALLGNLTGSAQFFNSDGFYNGVATQSLRFAYTTAQTWLARTPNAGNRKTHTLSVWIKRSGLSASQNILEARGSGDTGNVDIWFDANDRLEVSGSSTYWRTTTRKFRDVSSWYHIMIVTDTTDGTAADRLKIYVNGTRETSFSDNNHYSQNTDYAIGGNVEHRIGDGYGHFDGYMARYEFVDGIALDASYFGETKNGVWIPKKYTGSYGTNGHLLEFKQTGTSANSSGLGADTSGNDNHYTPTEITAIDSNLPDSPENNFATLNAVDNDGSILSEGNLKSASTSNSWKDVRSTFVMPTGSWYVELLSISGIGNGNTGIGVVPQNNALPSNNIFGSASNSWQYLSNGNWYNNNGVGGSGATFSATDIVGMSFDGSEVKFYKNNSLIHTLSSLPSNDYAIGISLYDTDESCILNFGQDSSFAGNKTAQGNTDGNGIGDFYYAPPTGFLALCTSNLPEPTISPNADTQADNYFGILTWSGDDNATRKIADGESSVTGTVDFTPDWSWIKRRNGSSNGSDHLLLDTSRGVDSFNGLSSNASSQEGQTEAGSTWVNFGDINNFENGGFTVQKGSDGSHTLEGINQSGGTYVGWNWKANGGTTSSNTDGSTTSTVQANTTAGFSIVTYAGNSASKTVGHGLDSAPEWVIAKSRTDAERWVVFHTSISNQYIYLNETFAGETSNADERFGDSSSVIVPNSTVVTLGANNSDVNENGDNYIMYCFHSVEGYSKFGSYTGNGSTDGTFVHTGFRPAFVLIKRTDTSGQDWMLVDSTRDTINPVDNTLFPSASTQELDGDDKDFLSNGFKHRSTGASENASGGTYIYMAFAEAPFKYANAR
jgi:hypothetical protein